MEFKVGLSIATSAEREETHVTETKRKSGGDGPDEFTKYWLSKYENKITGFSQFQLFGIYNILYAKSIVI